MTDTGSQARAQPRVPFFRPSCDVREEAAVLEVLRSGWLTTGPKAQALEARFAAEVGADFALAVNSCTAALHLALEAAGVGPGDKVLVPTMTFTASAEVVRYLGAHPVFTDVEYGTSLLTPGILEAALEAAPDAKAVVVVHFGGQAAPLLCEEDANGLLDICQARGVRVVEDAAHAFPAWCQDRRIGSLGDATCFSFYATKTLTTGEGGMLTTNDESIARRAEVMRLHGIDRDVWKRYAAGASRPGWEYDVVAPGYKYNLSDLAAAVGLAQLEKAHALHAERVRVAERYLDRLADVPHVDPPIVRGDPKRHAWHLFPIVLEQDAPVTRDQCIDLLWDRGVQTSVHYKPLHRMSYYRETYGLQPTDFPVAERIWAGCLSLPIYPALDDASVDYVCGALRAILAGG